MLSGIRFDQPQLARMQREEQSAQVNNKRQQRSDRDRSRSRSPSSKKNKKSHKEKKEKKEKKHKKKSKSSKKDKKSHKHSSSSHRDKRRKLPDGQEAAHADDSDSSSDSSSSSDSGSEDDSHRHHQSSAHHHHHSSHESSSSDHPMSSSATAPSSVPSSSSSMQRDSWMMPRVRSEEEVRKEAESRDRKEREKVEAQRKIDAEAEERKRQMAEGGLQGKFRNTASASTASSAPAVSVGDGGASWRARALQRAKERAVEEGSEVDQVVRDRFGDDFTKGSSKANSSSSSSNYGASASSSTSSSMEIVETEEEIEVREKREKAKKASSGPPPRTEIGRLMKKPAHLLAVPSSEAESQSATTASTSSSSSWRDKIRKNLTATAAPKTPEGETSALFSTPTVGGQGAVAPSPSPNPSPIPETALFDPLGDSRTAAKPLRFAGELSPETLGMDSALGLKLDPVNVEKQLHGQKDIEAALPQFAAGFLPVEDENASKAATATATTPASKTSSSSLPTGASDADLNKLSAQAQIAKLRKNTELYESLTKQIAELKAARVQVEATKQVTSDASHAQHELLHQKARAAEAANPAGTAQAALHGHLLSHGSAIDERIRVIQSSDDSNSMTDSGKQVVMLDTHDAFGRPINYTANRAKEAAAASGMPQRDPTMKNKRLAPNIDAEGNRVAYFADDVKEQSLRDLVEKEKLARQSAALGLASREYHDMDRDYAMSIMRDSSFKLADTDEQFDDADWNMSKFDRSTSLKNQKRSAAELEARSKSQQIHQQQKHENLIERCWYCLQGSKEVLKSLIVSIGVRVYLSIPRVNWITEGHVLIVPIEHNLSQTHMEDDVFEEVNYFKKHLVQCFAARNQRCVFLETVHDLNRKRHTVIECIPLDQQQYEEAKIYFVKAINEADEEWAQNKKLIRFTSDKGGVRKAIPKNFSYFSVEFGITDGGMAHPIEDHDAFPENFGKEVILGMMGESAHMWLRGKRAGQTEENRRLQDFLTAWKKFDWTKKLTKNQAPASSSSNAAAASR